MKKKIFAGLGALCVLCVVVLSYCYLTYTPKWNEITYEESKELMNDWLPHFIYYGYAGCPWCEEAEPILKEAAEEAQVDVNYVSLKDADGVSLVTDEMKSEMAELLADYPDDYIDDAGDFHFYVPTFIVTANGEVVSQYMGTISGHNPSKEELTEEQKEELKATYKDMLLKAKLFSW